MHRPSTTFRIKQGATRCYPYLADILTFYAITFQAIAGDDFEADPPSAVMACSAGSADLHISLAGFLKAAHTNKPRQLIDVHMFNKQPEPDSPNIDGIKSLNVRVIVALFSLFVERANDWVKYNVSTDYINWPPVSNFSRVVRNAIVHGGRININNQNAPVVTWRGLSYSHAQFGKEIINTGDLSTGDLILLMIELEIEIAGLGAPIPLN
jgi:hypothetical protein